MTFHGKLCHAQFVAHIAGQILVCCLPSCFRVVGIRCGVFEDDAGQLRGDALIVTGCPQQLRHVGQIDLAVLTDGYRQCLAGSVHMGNDALGADGTLGEHISLGLKLLVFIQVFQ